MASAGRDRAVERNRVLGHIGHEDRERVAPFEGAHSQPSGEAPHQTQELRKTHRPAGLPVDEGSLLAQLLHFLERESDKVDVWDLGLERAAE